MATAFNRKIHFHSGDDRFCGEKAPFRQFTTDPNEVTCRDCQARDTFVLSDEAAAYVASLVKTGAAP